MREVEDESDYIITNRHGLCSLYFFSFGAFIPYQAASFSMPSFAGALISSQVLHHENGRGSLGRYRELNSSLSFFDCCAGARSKSHLTDSLANIGAVSPLMYINTKRKRRLFCKSKFHICSISSSTATRTYDIHSSSITGTGNSKTFVPFRNLNLHKVSPGTAGFFHFTPTSLQQEGD